MYIIALRVRLVDDILINVSLSHLYITVGGGREVEAGDDLYILVENA